jgi:serine/threonine protein kinase
VGTLRYMSPEQVSGAPLDRRSDVFSLGASCFELVAYAPAYAGSTHEMITRIAAGPVPRLLDAVPEVDPRLDAILSRAMALDPLDRFEDLDALRLELVRLRLDMDPEAGVHLRSRVAPSDGGRVSSSVRSRPAVSRRRPGLIAGLGVASLVAVVVIGFGAFWTMRQRPASTPDAANAPAASVPPAATGLPGAQSASPSTPDASNAVNEVWQRLALGERAAVLQLLRPGTPNRAAPDPQLQSAVVDAVRTSVRRARDAASATPASRSSDA